MKKFAVFLFAFLTATTLFAQADWTVLVYVQSRNNLNKFAAKNLNDMAAVGSNQNVNILVQWYQLHQSGAWRYKIDKNKLSLDTFLPAHTDGNGVEDLVDSARWAVTKYPAKKYFLILWNHGFGILDPIWGRLRGTASFSPIFSSPRFEIEGITKGIELENHRAILFNETTKTYMDNKNFVQALSKIKTDVLKNRKLDLLGMDACLMAMLEVAYQARGYAEYMVGSQEVELAHGWDYLTLMQGLSVGGLSSVDLAKSIILIYKNYYKNKINFYTQSVVALENVVYVKQNVDQVVNFVDECRKYDSFGVKNLIKEARKKCLQFSTRSYVDLHSFYSEFYKQLDVHYCKNAQNTNSNSSFGRLNTNKKSLLLKNVNDLKKVLNDGKKLIENSVIANVAGSRHSLAKGLSIYFPTNRIDVSYAKTEFAQEGLWLKFLQNSL